MTNPLHEPPSHAPARSARGQACLALPRAPGGRINLSLLLPLAAFAALVILLIIGLGTTEQRQVVKSPLIGRPAPAFELPRLHAPGETFSTRELAGEPWLLNVWGSWCFACRQEHDWITRLGEEAGIPLVGFNWKDRREDALAWLDRFGDAWTLHVADREGRAAIDWGVYGAPETFLVDAKGVIRHKIIGPLDAESYRDLMARVQALEEG